MENNNNAKIGTDKIDVIEIEQIGLRVSKTLNEKLDRKAKEIGISKNALILVLIDVGFNAYEKMLI